MADLGNLNFGIHLKDYTPQEYEAIKKKLVNMHATVSAKVGLKVDVKEIEDKVDSLLKNKTYKVKLEVDSESIKKLTETFRGQGINTGELRAMRGVSQIMRADAYANSQKTLEQLRNARLQAAKAADTHNAAMKRSNTTMSSQSRIAGELRNQIANVYSIYAAERFIRGLYTIGGEFQKQRIALTSIIGDSMKAETIFNRIKELAVASPFQFKELASYAKQLSAYSLPYEELYDTTKRLADISAGVGVDMGRIILAYGQVRSAAFLRGQELRQFTEAGIPLVDELAKKFTELTGKATSAGDVFDKISRKEVSFGMVKDVLWELTNEGGKFYNMQEALAESLAGKWSNLQDAWDVMMADIAESNSGVLSDSLELLTKLMNHWEEVVVVLGTLTGAYGFYKTAVIAINAVEKANLKIETVQVIVNRARAIKGLTTATKAQTVAQWALNAAMKANPWVIAIAAVGALAGLYFTLGDRTKSLSEKTRELNIEFEKNIENIKEQENKAKGYISQIFNKTTEIDAQRRAYINLQKIYPGVFDNMKFEQFLLEGEYQAIQKVISASKEREKIKSAGVVIEATNNRNEAKRQLDALKMQRQQVATLPGGSAKLGDIDKRIKSQTEVLEQAQKALNDALKTYETYTSAKGGQQGKEPAWFKKATELYEKFDIERLKPDAEGGFQKYIESIVGANEDASSTLNEWTKKEGEWNEETRKSIDKAKQLKNATDEILKTFGRVTKETKGTAQDPIAEQWKERADLIEKAISSYEKWRKIEGEEVAAQRVKNVPEFAPVFDSKGVNLDLSDPSKSYKYIQSQLDQSKEKQKDLYVSLGVKIDKEQIENAKKEADNALKEIEKYISQAGEKWDLYKKLFETTGNKALSMNIAFGGSVSFESIIEDFRNQLGNALEKAGSKLSVTDVLTMKEEDVKKKFGEGDILKLYQSISEEGNKMRSESLDNLLGMIEDYKDYSQKIEDIERNRQKDIADIEKNRENIGGKETDKLIKEVNKRAEEDTTSVLFDQFKESSNWARIFDDLDRVSTSTLDDMISKVEEFSKKQGLSIEDTKELVEALRKLRGEFAERSPFKALGESFNSIKEAKNRLDALKSSGASKEEIDAAENDLNSAYDDQSKAIQGVIGKFDALAGAADFLGGVFENLGLGTGLSDAAGILGGGLQGASQGMGLATSLFGKSAGPWGAAAGAALSLISGIAQLHDKRLERSIQRSKQRVEELKSAYDQLGKSIDRTLGGDESIERVISLYDQLEEQAKRAGSSLTESYKMSFRALKDEGTGYVDELKKRINSMQSLPPGMQRFMGLNFKIGVDKEALEALEKVGVGKELDNSAIKQYQAQYVGLVAQRAEIEGQLRDEEGKKKSDAGKIQDYKNQLAELNEQIAYFVEDLTKELYGIDFQDWAGQISDALTEAFANGEDAAQAFDNVVNNIMRSVANNILKNLVIQPMFEKLQNMLFGEKGLFKEFTDIEDNGVLAAEAIKSFFDNEGKAMIDASQTFLEAFDKASGGALTATGESSTSGLSKGIQGVTEDTANLLGSYLNSIRQDVSIKRALLEKLGNEIFPKYNILAEQQLTQLRAIANNTLRSAQNTEANLAVLKEFMGLVGMVIDKGKRKINI